MSWVSPNTWGSYIYGNVRFAFDWAEMIKGKQFYWVGAIAKYNPTAYRILMTGDRYDSLPQYDPSGRDGPLYYDGTEWYMNGKYTGEFMVDSNLRLDNCVEIRVVNHNRRYCNKDGSSYPDRGLPSYKAGPRFLANLLGRDVLKAKDIEILTDSSDLLTDIFHLLEDYMVEGQNVMKRCWGACFYPH